MINRSTRRSALIPAKAAAQMLPRQGSFRLSSVTLAIYIFSIIYLANTPEGKLSTYVGFGFAYTFGLEFLTTRTQRIFLPREFIFLVMLLLFMLTSGLWAAQPGLAISQTITVLQLMVFSVISLNVVLAQRSIWPVALGIFVGLSWAIFTALRENGFAYSQPVTYRPGSTLVNPNIYAIALLMGVWIAVYVLVQGNSPLWRKWSLVALIILAVHQIMFYAGSVKGILALAFSIPLFLSVRYGLLARPRLGTRIGVILLLFGIYFVGEWLLAQTPYYWRVEELGQRFEAADDRFQMIQFAINRWEDKPILGHGANQFRAAYDAFAGRFSYSHNNYAELLYNTGLVGLILYYGAFMAIAARYRKSSLSLFQLTWGYVGLIELMLLSTAMVIYHDKLVWIAISVMLSIVYLSDKMRNEGQGSDPEMVQT